MPQSDPRYLFTLASEGDRRPAALLFFDRAKEPISLHDLAPMIAESDIFRSLFPGGAIIRHAQNTEVLNEGIVIVEDDTYEEAFQPLETVTPGGVYHWSPDTGLKYMDYEKMFYGCHKPQKNIVGCLECVRDFLPKEDNPEILATYCELAQIDRHANDEYLCGEETLELLRNRESQIGDYTYISPKLTATENFQKMLRPPLEHDFDEVAKWSLLIKKGIRERARRKQFKKENCDSCSVANGCYIQRRHPYCNGKYTFDVRKLAGQIIPKDNLLRKWKDWQIATVLRNSGIQDARYKRCIVYLTFGRGGEVILRRTRSRRILREFTNWEEIEEYLKQTHGIIYSQDTVLPVECRPLLWMLTQFSASPRYGAGFKHTTYSTCGVSAVVSRSYDGRKPLHVVFHAHYYVGHGWSNTPLYYAEYDSIDSVFGAYRFLPGVMQTRSDCGR